MGVSVSKSLLSDAKFFAIIDGIQIQIQKNSAVLHHSDGGVPHLELFGYFLGGTAYKPIKKVIFNDPATIVIWNDETKTVVKCQEGDTFSEELGLAMAISKKFFGNKGAYNEVFKKWVKKGETDGESTERRN